MEDHVSRVRVPLDENLIRGSVSPTDHEETVRRMEPPELLIPISLPLLTQRLRSLLYLLNNLNPRFSNHLPSPFQSSLRAHNLPFRLLSLRVILRGVPLS